MSNGLTGKEAILFQLIQQNPYISQQELADRLNLSRPTVANMISTLMKKGYIVGRAYIVRQSQPVVCIGGANVDRKFHLKGPPQLGTSNPVFTSKAPGGVARNIAENLGRLGLDVELITVSGKDSDWNFIEDISKPYMKLDHVHYINGMTTGSYTAVLDEAGEMVIALADMDIYDELTVNVVQQYEPLLYQARCIVADLNCPKETLSYLCQFARDNNKPIVFIPVSSPKMKRLPEKLNGINWLIVNRDETETVFQKKIESENDWKEAVRNWLNLGIEYVAVTNGAKGAMFGHKEQIIHAPAIATKTVVDVTGAGDAFSSAIIYSWLEGKDLKEIALAATINAYKTLLSPYTVRQDLSAMKLNEEMEELK